MHLHYLLEGKQQNFCRKIFYTWHPLLGLEEKNRCKFVQYRVVLLATVTLPRQDLSSRKTKCIDDPSQCTCRATFRDDTTLVFRRITQTYLSRNSWAFQRCTFVRSTTKPFYSGPLRKSAQSVDEKPKEKDKQEVN